MDGPQSAPYWSGTFDAGDKDKEVAASCQNGEIIVVQWTGGLLMNGLLSDTNDRGWQTRKKTPDGTVGQTRIVEANLRGI